MDYSVLACWLSPSLLPVQANVPPYGPLHMLRKRKSAVSLQVGPSTCSKRYYAISTSSRLLVAGIHCLQLSWLPHILIYTTYLPKLAHSPGHLVVGQLYLVSDLAISLQSGVAVKVQRQTWSGV
jgi:hypothetical protein